MNFDPRITPARGDLAAKHLEGKVTAARFVEGEEREVIDAQAPLRAQPAPDAPLAQREKDFVAVAERLLGVPYLWGGKTNLGIDCSGLVQVALNAAGTGCPRDSDMQEVGLGRALSQSESKKLQRGDLIFWNGHVAIVRDADSVVHANAHHMATAVENTRDAIARIKAAGSEVTGIKRL